LVYLPLLATANLENNIACTKQSTIQMCTNNAGTNGQANADADREINATMVDHPLPPTPTVRDATATLSPGLTIFLQLVKVRAW
jgi:hypothetical protein